MPVLARRVAGPLLLSTLLSCRKVLSSFLCHTGSRTLTFTIYEIDHFAASSFEFQYLLVHATDADEWNDKKIDNDPKKDHPKGSQSTHPIPRLNDRMGPKGRNQKSYQRYLSRNNSNPYPNGFQGRSFLLEKRLNFTHDQGVFILAVFSVHENPL
jgi:hypothetical protein